MIWLLMFLANHSHLSCVKHLLTKSDNYLAENAAIPQSSLISSALLQNFPYKFVDMQVSSLCCRRIISRAYRGVKFDACSWMSCRQRVRVRTLT